MALLGIERLLRKRAEPASRAAELDTLHARFRAQPSARAAGAEAVASAERLRALRLEMSAAFTNVNACFGCARGRPEPNGHWRGGSCCGGNTLELFSAPEVAALKLAGVSASDLEAPRGDHAGCAFRGPEGCTLTPDRRPNICVRHVCMELRAELVDAAEGGDEAAARWRNIKRLGAALRDEWTRFLSLV